YRTGAVVEKTFRADEKVGRATIDKREMQYLYREGSDYVFVDTESYDLMFVAANALGESVKYLTEGNSAILPMWEGEVLGVDLPAAPDAYAEQLLRGVEAHQPELDGLLREYSEHWAVERMPAVDRAVLRLGCFELAHEPEVPTAVVISEAVELATQYSTENSGRFVNGLLARVAEQVRPP